MQIKEIMTKDVITVSKEDSVEKILKLLNEKKISGVPVIENGKVIGIVSKTDLLYKEKEPHLPAFIYFLDSIIYLENPKNLERDLKKFVAQTAGEIMNQPVLTISESAPVNEALDLMLKKKINRLPVVDENQNLTGIVTRDNLLSVLKL